MRRPLVIACGMLALGFGVGTGLAAQDTASRLSMRVEHGRLTCDIRNVTLSEVLDTLGRQTRVAFTLGDGIEPPLVSLQLADVPVEEGVRQLLRAYDVFLYYAAGPAGRSSLQAVWVFPKGLGASARPVPPDVWAGSAELRERARSGDVHTREQAYVALMSRPDAESRAAVLDALRGATETDQGLRQRLWSHAFQQGMDVPGDLLAEVARIDGSEMVRLMALDALAGDPAVRDVAAALVDDPSAVVQRRAREIVAEWETPRRPVPP